MVDLEMDFNVVIPGKIFFINQSGIYMKTQSMNASKIKTIDCKIPNFYDLYLITET
jgi:hypothetical protein